MAAALELPKDDDPCPECPRGDWKPGPECLNCRQSLDCVPFERAFLEECTEGIAVQKRAFSIRPDVAPMIVTEQGAAVGLNTGRLEVKKSADSLGFVRINEISSLQLNGAVQISTQALRELSERGVPILLCSQSGYLMAQILKSANRDGLARVAQIRSATNPVLALELAKRMVAGKLHNQWVLLRRRSGKNGEGTARLKHSMEKASKANDKSVLLGIEGDAAKNYFSALSGLIGNSSEFRFTGRSRRPPLDPFNSMLSYCYAVLHTEVLKAVLAAGLDPAVGFLHELHSGRDSLVCDLVEEFRSPIVDATVLSVINRRQVSIGDFHFDTNGSCFVQGDAKKILLTEIERRFRECLKHPVFGYRLSWRRAIQLQAVLLKHSLVSQKFQWKPFLYR